MIRYEDDDLCHDIRDCKFRNTFNGKCTILCKTYEFSGDCKFYKPKENAQKVKRETEIRPW